MQTPTHHQSLPERIRKSIAPAMIQIAPGVYAKRTDAPEVQEVTLARYVPDGTGYYRLIPFQERFCRLDQKVLDLIGMSRQRMTMIRLARAGFIEMIMVAPRTYLLNLDSWFNHVRRCAEMPDIWEPGSKYLKEYRRAIA